MLTHVWQWEAQELPVFPFKGSREKWDLEWKKISGSCLFVEWNPSFHKMKIEKFFFHSSLSSRMSFLVFFKRQNSWKCDMHSGNLIEKAFLLLHFRCVKCSKHFPMKDILSKLAATFSFSKFLAFLSECKNRIYILLYSICFTISLTD